MALVAGNRSLAQQPPAPASWLAPGPSAPQLAAQGLQDVLAAQLQSYSVRVLRALALAAPALTCIAAHNVPRRWSAVLVGTLLAVLAASAASITSLHQGGMLLLLCWRHLFEAGRSNLYLLHTIIIFDMSMTVLSALAAGQVLLPLVLTELALLGSVDALLGCVASGSLPGRR
jgi:hypothetical protein